MLILLVRKELLEQLLTLRFAMACVICMVVILSSVFVLTKDYKESLADYRTNVVMHKKEVEESNDLVWGGIKVDKPLNVMQIFLRGVDRKLGATAKVNGFAEAQFEADYDRNPITSLFPPIDLLFFIGVVMSLLAIAFSYDAVSGEKELGTLKLLMSYSLPRDQVLLAKWIGGYLALIAPFVMAFVCGLVIVVMFPTVELKADHWVELGIILMIALAYLSSFYSLGVFVSARTHLASTSITVLLMIWVTLVLALPNVAPYLAVQLKPARTISMVDKEKYQIERDEEEKFQKALEQWGEDHPEVPRNRGTWWAKWDELKRDQLLRLIGAQEKINDQFQIEMAGQIQLAKSLSRISPLASFTYAVSDVAGTGIENRNRFMDLLVDYRKEITRFGLDQWIIYDGEERWRDYTIEGYPKFAFKESRLQDRTELIFADILLLLVWNIVFFMGAYLSFLRYDVT